MTVKTPFKRLLKLIVAVALLGGMASGCAFRAERQVEAELDRTAQARLAPPAPLPANAGLEELLAYAEANNRELGAAFARWLAARERIPQARGLPDPRLTYGYFLEEVETRVGPQRQKIGLAQTIPWPGKLSAAAARAAAAAGVARAEYESARLELARRLRTAWAEYWYLGQAQRVTAEHHQLLQDLEAVIERRYGAGGAQHADLIRARIERGRLADRLASLEAMDEPVRARLNALLHRPLDAPLNRPEALPRAPALPGAAYLEAALARGNPELAVRRARLAAAKAGVRRARQDYYPDITLGGEFIDTDRALMSGVPGSGTDPIVASLSLTLPLWRGRYRAAVAEAAAGAEAAAAALEAGEDDQRARLAEAAYWHADAGRKYALYRDELIPPAEQSLAVIRQSFQAGRASYLDLIAAERTLLELVLARQRAEADRVLRRAEIEWLTGDPPPAGAGTRETGETEDAENREGE